MASVASAQPATIAQRFEANARVMHLFDRQGRLLETVGDRAVYGTFAVSLDGTRIAAIKQNLEEETHDLWVLDIASGSTTRLTTSTKGSDQRTLLPVWAPDGRTVAYVALRGGYWGIYETSSDGKGREELLYRHPGANLQLSDWSLDGRYVIFSNSDLVGGALYALPVTPEGAGRPIELFRSTNQLSNAKLSPDNRFLSYTSTEAGRGQVYLRRFDPASAAAATETPIHVPGPLGSALLWRTDGRQLYYQIDGALIRIDQARRRRQSTGCVTNTTWLRPGSHRTPVSSPTCPTRKSPRPGRSTYGLLTWANRT